MNNNTDLINNEIINFHKITHELKNSLSICNGYFNMLDRKELDKVKYLNTIKDEIDRSLNILKNYSNTKLDIRHINLITLYNDIKNLFKLICPKDLNIIILDNKDIEELDADYNKIKQVLINIIKNSYEAKDNYNKLLITIKTITTENTVKIIIIDNGIGMNKSELKNIYNNFYTTKQNGTGLGIPLIKDIIMMHNGKIKYISRKNIGTKIIIELPKKSPKTFNNNSYYL